MRQQILDLKLDDIKINRFHQSFKGLVRVQYGKISENSNAMIDQFVSIEVNGQIYYTIAFDSCEVANCSHFLLIVCS